MRTILFSSTFMVAACLAPMAHSADGTINFTGTILEGACTVEPGSATQNVSLGTVNKAAFVNAGDRASSAPFSVVFNSCNPAVTRVALRFYGRPAAGNNQLLGLTASTGAAAGVGIGLFESDGSTLVPLGTKSLGIAAPASGASARLDFTAKYVATADVSAITGGPANAVATFTLDYN